MNVQLNSNSTTAFILFSDPEEESSKGNVSEKTQSAGGRFSFLLSKTQLDSILLFLLRLGLFETLRLWLSASFQNSEC